MEDPTKRKTQTNVCTFEAYAANDGAIRTAALADGPKQVGGFTAIHHRAGGKMTLRVSAWNEPALSAAASVKTGDSVRLVGSLMPSENIKDGVKYVDLKFTATEIAVTPKAEKTTAPNEEPSLDVVLGK